MELEHLGVIFRRYGRAIILLCLSATANAVLLTYLVSEKYRATALVLIRPQEAIKLNPETTGKELFDFPVTFGIPFQTTSRTYGEVIRSRAVAERVVERLRLDRIGGEEPWYVRIKNKGKQFLKDIWTFLKYGTVREIDPFERATLIVSGCLSVTPGKNTYVFEISCKFKDGKISADIANAAADAFVEYSIEASTAEARRARGLAEEQVHESEQALLSSQALLQRFKENNHTVQLTEEMAVRIEELSQARSSYDEVVREIDGVQAELREIRRQIDQEDEYLRLSSTIRENPTVAELRIELAKLEVERSALLQKLTQEHPEIVALQARVAEIEKLLEASDAMVASEETSSVNEVRQEREKELLRAESELEGLEARKAVLISRMEELRNELGTMPAVESRLEKLELDAKVARETFQFVRRELDEARVNEAERRPEIRVVSAARAPTYPESPIKIHHAGVSFLMALVIGLLVALGLEYANTRVRSVSEAEAALGCRVLATIPVAMRESPPKEREI